MLTSDFKDKTGMNDSQSTFLGNNPSFKQQIDLFSNLMNDDGKTSMKKQNMFSTLTFDKDKEQAKKENAHLHGTISTMDGKNAGVLSILSKHNRNKKEKIQVYNEIDRDFFAKEKPANPLDFINTDNQKVMINPGMPYVSTS